MDKVILVRDGMCVDELVEFTKLYQKYHTSAYDLVWGTNTTPRAHKMRCKKILTELDALEKKYDEIYAHNKCIKSKNYGKDIQWVCNGVIDVHTWD